MATSLQEYKKAISDGKYTGPLAEPIYEPIMGLLGELVRPQAEERAREQQVLKLHPLFDWYEIDRNAPDAWMKLASVLASAHVPGMRVIHDFRRKGGRKRSWKAGKGIELVRDVEALRANRSMTTQEAIRALRKDKTRGWHVFTEENLITRHREARKAEQERRTMAKQLMGSPTSELKGGILGLLSTKPTELDGNSN